MRQFNLKFLENILIAANDFLYNNFMTLAIIEIILCVLFV